MEPFTEIFKLKKMLEDAGIPFDWFDMIVVTPCFQLSTSYQICYPCYNSEKRWISVIEGPYSYGATEDKLETMRNDSSDVTGWVPAIDVFNQIKKDWEGRMKRKIFKIDEDTLELTEIEVEVKDDAFKDIASTEQILHDKLIDALDCTIDEFSEKYKAYKTAEKKFNEIYEPFKEKLLTLYKNNPDIPKTLIVKDAKLTYVSSSIRNTIDSKRLKEEEPEIAKKFTKQSIINPTIRIGDA